MSQYLSSSYGKTTTQYLLRIVLFFASASLAVQLLPNYWDSYLVEASLKKLGDNPQLASLSKQELRSDLLASFRTNSVSPLASDSVVIKAQSSGYFVDVNYEKRIAIIGNVDIILSFKHQLDTTAPSRCCN